MNAALEDAPCGRFPGRRARRRPPLAAHAQAHQRPGVLRLRSPQSRRTPSSASEPRARTRRHIAETAPLSGRVAPIGFPHGAHRSGRAEFPHPAPQITASLLETEAATEPQSRARCRRAADCPAVATWILVMGTGTVQPTGHLNTRRSRTSFFGPICRPAAPYPTVAKSAII